MKLPEFNAFSLLLGILVGIFVLLLYLKIKTRIPKLGKSINKKKPHSRTHENSDLLLRQFMLRKVQSLHLAADLFPLTALYVPQKLYSHPLYANYGENIEDEPLFFREAPQISDVPELASAFPMPAITLSQAITNKRNIAVSGIIGSGKTTCLAKLAGEILEHARGEENFQTQLPIYLDIRSLTCQENPTLLLEAIARALYDENEDLLPGLIKPVLDAYLTNLKLLVLIDGLDELAPEDFRSAVGLLQHYHKEYPEVQLVVTCGPYYTDGLSQGGFAVLPIRYPDRSDYYQLIQNWFSAWDSRPDLNSNKHIGLSESKLKQLWLKQSLPSSSYFELTVQVMAALFQDHLPENKPSIPYLFRKTNNSLSIDILQKTAEWMSDHQYSGITANDFSELVSTVAIGPGKNSIIHGNPDDLLQELEASNLLHAIGGTYFFSNPSFLVHLLSNSTCHAYSHNINDLSHFPLEDSITRHSSSSQNYLVDWIKETKLRESKVLSIFLNHLFDPSLSPPDFSFAFAELANRILSSATPLSEKIKLASIIYYTKPSQLLQLLSRLEDHPSPNLRKLCAFFYGLSSVQKHTDYLVKCAMDKNPSVKVIGLNSLVNNLDRGTNTLLAQIIRSSKDDAGKIASELLAQDSPLGHNLLKELITDEGSVCRRNVIYGLRLISMDWADDLLRELNSSDKAWIIRDAAAITLENKWDPASYAPRILSKPSDDPKLLRIASTRKQGIPANTYPMDFLMETLNSNNFDEMLLAIQYLTVKPVEETIKVMQKLTGYDNPVREIACQVLFENDLQT